MAFWRSETLRERLPVDQLIEPFDDSCIKHGAYELHLGPEVFITSSDDKVKKSLAHGEPVVIPSGQFGLLLTEEYVKIPPSVVAFISMRFGVKRRGLINVSGFHVDPGYHGRIKFSVYNAGSGDITLSRGDRVFMIWFATFDGVTTDVYRTVGCESNQITSADQNDMQGYVASPGELKNRIEALGHLVGNLKWLLGVGVGALIAILLRLCFMTYFADVPQCDIQKIKSEVLADMERLLQRKDDAAESDRNAPSGSEPQNRGVPIEPMK